MSIGLRDPRIDALRGLSILLVLLHHFSIAYHLPQSPLGALLTPGVVRAVVRNGNYGVTMFFVISGFLITSNALRRWGGPERIGLGLFYTLRVARIGPCLLLLLVLVGVLSLSGLAIFRTHPSEMGRAVAPWLVYLAALTFWTNVLIDRFGWVNYALGVLWSLSVEEVFYLVFPVCCVVLRRPLFIAALCLVIVAVAPAWRLLHQGDDESFLYAFPAAADGIAIGVVAALLAARLRPGWAVPGAVRLALMLGMAVLYLSASIHQTNVWGVTLMALATAMLLLPGGGGLAGRPLARPLRWFGALSYELYLFHLVVLGLLRTAWPRGQIGDGAVLPLLLAFLLLSALLAWLIGLFFAEPANRLVRHLAAPRAMAA